MHLLLLYVPLILICATILLFLTWLVSFSVLMYVIQRRHPIYYKKIGQPYTWFTSTDIAFKSGGLRRVRARAWFRYLRKLYKAIPDLVYRDKTCRRLALTYRRSIRVFLVVVVVSVLAVLPQTAMLFTGDTQTAKITKTTGGTATVTTVTSTSNQSSSNSSGGTTQITPHTYTTTQVNQSTTMVTNGIGSNDPVPTPKIPTPAKPQPETNYLSRADVTSILSSVAPPGQNRARKQDVCQTVVGQEATNSDVGPPGAVCTDANLLTYSAY